jgi:branched-chain amino acid transport system ATP-binding protein
VRQEEGICRPGTGPARLGADVFTHRLYREEGLTILLAERNVAVSLALADRGYVLENRRIVVSGDGRALLADNRVRQAYVGL